LNSKTHSFSRAKRDALAPLNHLLFSRAMRDAFVTLPCLHGGSGTSLGLCQAATAMLRRYRYLTLKNEQ
jgi:hypothetical protein